MKIMLHRHRIRKYFKVGTLTPSFEKLPIKTPMIKEGNCVNAGFTPE